VVSVSVSFEGVVRVGLTERVGRCFSGWVVGTSVCMEMKWGVGSNGR